LSLFFCLTQGTVWEQLCLLRGNIQIRFKSPNLIDSLIFSVAFVCSLTNTMKGEIQGSRAGTVVWFRPCVLIWDDFVFGFNFVQVQRFSFLLKNPDLLDFLGYYTSKWRPSTWSFGVCIKRTGLFIVVFLSDSHEFLNYSPIENSSFWQ